MQESKYNPISTAIPQDEDDTNEVTPTKTSVNHPNRAELKDEEDLLLYETRTPSKPIKNKAASYKVVRIFTLGLLMAIVATLLVLCTYMCITTECVSRNYRDLCQEGFCYEVDVDKFHDSNDDKVGDFIGIKQSLKSLREFGIQTVIVPLSSFKSTAPHHDAESFVAMAKEGLKLGLSTIIRVDESPNSANLEVLNKVNSTISGFIASRDSPFFDDNKNWTKNLKCYTIVSSPNEINVPRNGCVGTFYESRDIFDLGSDAMLTLKGSNVTNSSVNVISLSSLDGSVAHRNEKFLGSLLLSSLTNGAISIKSGDELGVNLNGNYSGALNSNDTFQANSRALMKSIKSNRQYSPKIGRYCAVDLVSIDGHPNVKAVTKKCAEDGVRDSFLAIYNGGDKEAVLSVNSTLKDFSPVASMKILIQVQPPNSPLITPVDTLTLPPQALVLVYVKYNPVVAA